MKTSITLLYVTHQGMVGLAPNFMALLERNWPNHPPMLVITDKGRLPGTRICETGIKEWVPSLAFALAQPQVQETLGNHVILLLDDLVPLWAVDDHIVQQHLEVMKAEGWGKLSLFIDEPTSPPLEKLSIDGSTFYCIPRPGSGPNAELFPWYNSLQVSIWRSDYLLKVCQLSLNLGVTDPWKFEHIHAPENHFVSAYRWPAVFQGLHYLKNVNLKAVRGINGCQKIKTQLYLAYIAKLPSQLRWKLSLKMKRLRVRILQKS